MKTIAISLALFLTALLVIGGITSSVSAVGTPSENFTTPESPLTDNATHEIKPANCVLQEASAQMQTTQPSINFDFISQSSQDKYAVTGNENWELLIDINLPGLIYIYEYLPAGSNPSGKWIAYKWQAQSGIWKLGPFTPDANEPAGQHLYRVWYYADGKWAADIPSIPFKERTWTYIKAPATQVVPATPVTTTPVIPAPVKEPAKDDPFQKFITNPIVLLAGPSLLVVIVILIRYLMGRVPSRKPVAELIPAPVAKPTPKQIDKVDQTVEEPPAVLVEEEPMPARGRLVFPDGLEIQLNEKSRIIGRADLARALEMDQLGQISRKHFEITFSKDNFLIEDKASANGTSLNGKNIAGQGPVKLNDADLIEPADVIKLKFLVL